MSDDFLRFLQDESKPVVMRNMLALSLEVAKQKDRIAALEAQLAAAEARLAELTGVLAECADDIAAYVDADYPEPTRSKYPDIQRRYNRDMELVCRARDLLTRAGIIGGDAP
jgi:hypothetical protein